MKETKILSYSEKLSKTIQGISQEEKNGAFNQIPEGLDRFMKNNVFMLLHLFITF